MARKRKAPEGGMLIMFGILPGFCHGFFERPAEQQQHCGQTNGNQHIAVNGRQQKQPIPSEQQAQRKKQGDPEAGADDGKQEKTGVG